MRHINRARLSWAALPLVLLTACGDDQTVVSPGLTCGTGTVASADGTCVPDFEPIVCASGTTQVGDTCVPAADRCPAGQTFSGGECIDAIDCAAGTLLDTNGHCVPAENLCTDDDYAYIDGECVPLGCAAGTANIDGECVAVDGLCEDGLVYSGGDCRPERACGAGTIELDGAGECVPAPDATPDVLEWPEPNVAGWGPTTPFSLPVNEGETILLGGVIEAPRDQNGDNFVDVDFDEYTFQGSAGQRLRIEGTALGAQQVGFLFSELDATGTAENQWWGMPVESRNAARELVLPRTGAYSLFVGQFAYGYGAVEWNTTGGPDFSYLVAVTPIANPAPTANVSGNFTVSGDLADVPQFHITAPAGSLVDLSIETDNVDVDGIYWINSPDYNDDLGRFAGGVHGVPDTGLLVTADYYVAGADDLGYTLTSRRIDPTFLALPGPRLLEDEVVARADTNYYRITPTEEAVVRVSIDTTSVDLAARVLDANFRQVAELAEVYGTTEYSAHLLVRPGTYYVTVQSTIATDAPGPDIAYDLAIDDLPVQPIGAGLIDAETATISATALNDLTETGAEAYFFFDVGSFGAVTLDVVPDADLDVLVELYATEWLALGDVFYPDGIGDYDGLGGAEALEWTSVADRVLVRVLANEVAQEAPADVPYDMTVSLEPGAVMPYPEQEPNDYIDEASVFSDHPEPLTGDSLWGYGALEVDNTLSIPQARDAWGFTLDRPGTVEVRTHALGLLPVDLSVDIVSSEARVVASSTGENWDDLADVQVQVDLMPGAYFIGVSDYLYWEGQYLVEVRLVDTYDVCVPDVPMCTGEPADTVASCNETGDGVRSEGAFTCVSGCDEALAACDVTFLEDENVTRNDTFLSATDIGRGSAVPSGATVVSSHIGLEGADVDWYRFTLSGVSRVTVETGPVAPDGDTDFDTYVILYDSEGRVLGEADWDEDFVGRFGIMEPKFLAAGTYYIKVFYPIDWNLAPGNYRLTLIVEPRACLPATGTCEGDVAHLCNATGTAVDIDLTCQAGCEGAGVCSSVTESEPNGLGDEVDDLNVFGAATDVFEMGRLTVSGRLADNADIDRYSLTLTEATQLELTTLNPPGGNPILDPAFWIYDEAGTQVEYIDNDYLEDYAVGLFPGTYTIEMAVSPWGSLWGDDVSGKYLLRITATPIPRLGGVLSPGDVVPATPGHFIGPESSQWHRIELGAAGQLTGAVTWEETYLNVDVEIYDSAYTEVVRFEGFETAFEALGPATLEAGTYYLRVHLVDYDLLDGYTLSLEVGDPVTP